MWGLLAFRRQLSATVLAAAVAACGRGVFIEVDTTTNLDESADRVEIITSKKHCTLPFDQEIRCDHVQGENFDRAFGTEDDIFTRHQTASIAVDASGSAVFELEPGSGELLMVFAIARDGQGVPIGVAAMEGTIDTDAGAIVYRVTLDKTRPLLAGRDEVRAGVVEWGVDTGRDCIGVEPITPDPQRGKLFIVPQDNPDCDSRTDPDECEPLWFHGYNADFESGSHCVLPSTHLGDANQAPCVLGHVPSCSDLDDDPSQVCLEQRAPPLCVPSAMCDTGGPCTSTRDEECLETALSGQAASGLLAPMVICKARGISIDPELVGACPDAEMIILRPAALGTAVCKTVKLTADAPPFHADGEDAVMIDAARFEIAGVDNNCNVSLKWSGSAQFAQALRKYTSVIAYELLVEGSVRKMLAPIVFTPENDCSAVPEPCAFDTFVGTNLTPDSMFQCAR